MADPDENVGWALPTTSSVSTLDGGHSPPYTTRRSFLKETSGLVLASIATTTNAAESSEKVRLAVIGTGARGSDLIRALTTIETADIVAVCDMYAPHREQGAKYAGGQTGVFSDYRKMLDEAKPQAVIVAVPLHLHFEVCRNVIAAGCDVFCEKTMCYDVPQAIKLAALVDERHTVFQVGLQRRANAIYRQAAAMVQTGMIGQVTAIKCQWHRNNNWRRPIPVARGSKDWPELERQLNWRLYREYSQGLMAELGSHQLDVVNWLLGTHPARVIATGGIDYWRDGREVRDNVFCIYDYHLKKPLSAKAGLLNGSHPGPLPEGEGDAYTARVTYSSLQNNAFEGASELVLGTRGTLFLTSKKGLLYREAVAEDIGWSNRADKNASVVTSGKTLKLSNDPWAHRGQPFEIDAEGDDTRDELVSFLEHVLARDPHTICDVQQGLINTATIVMANQAMDAGRAIDFPILPKS